MLPTPSEEQARSIEDFKNGHNVLVQAVAGGGKSSAFYLAALAHKETCQTPRVLILCYNKALQIKTTNDLENYGLASFVDAFTVHGLASQMFGYTISCDMLLEHALNNKDLKAVLPAPYTALLVDEVQDMSEFTLRTINLVITMSCTQAEFSAAGDNLGDFGFNVGVNDNDENDRSLAKRRRVSSTLPIVSVPVMCVGDLRQNLYGSHSGDNTGCQCLLDPGTMFQANGRQWKSHVYSISFRLTPALCNFVNTHFSGSPTGPTADIVPGNFTSKDIKPIYIEGDIYDESVNALTQALIEYAPSDIMVLSPSVESALYGACKRMVNVVSLRPNAPAFYVTDHMRGMSEDLEYKDKILVTTFFQAKGSERKCVIVLHADSSSIWDKDDNGVSDTPFCRNPMHVALTRSQEMLYVIRHTGNDVYPTMHLAVLDDTARVVHGRIVRPRDDDGIQTKKRVTRSVDWLIKHVNVKTVNCVLNLFDISEPETMGDPVATTARTSVSFRRFMADEESENGGGFVTVHENVLRYFPEAVLAAAGRNIIEYKYKCTRQSSLEKQVAKDLNSSRNTMIRLAFRDIANTILNNDGPQGPRDWLLISMIADAMRTNVFCRLNQIRNLEWVGAKEREYFASCVKNVISVVLRTREAGDFSVVESRNYLTTHSFRATIEYVEPYDGGFSSIPWVFSFADEPSQSDYMCLVAHMWFRDSPSGRIYLIPSNRLITLTPAEGEGMDDVLDNAMKLLVDAKQ